MRNGNAIGRRIGIPIGSAIGSVIGMVLLAAFGCGGNETQEPAQAPVTAPEPPPPPPPVYDLHEWGVLDVGPDGGVVGYQAGSLHGPTGGLGAAGVGYGLPILYVHLGEGVDAATIDLELRALQGLQHVEWFPRPGDDRSPASTISWHVEATRGACPAERRYPVVAEAGCVGILDHQCEAASLAAFENPESACLGVSDARQHLLFYRSAPTPDPNGNPPPPLELPLETTHAGYRADLELERKAGSTDSTVGSIWFVARGYQRYGLGLRGRSGGAGRGGLVVPSPILAERIDWPAPGGRVTVPFPETELSGEDGQRALREDLIAHGLTAPEAAAFEEGWRESLFGPRAPAAMLLYWLPRSDVDELVAIDATPPPRAVHRATLVRVLLR